MSVNHSVRRHNKNIVSIFFNIKLYCVFSLKSPHRGDSNKYTQYTIFNTNKENHPKLTQICSYEIFKGLKNEFETAVVNEPLVIEPLKFYCNLFLLVRVAENPAVYPFSLRTYDPITSINKQVNFIFLLIT